MNGVFKIIVFAVAIILYLIATVFNAEAKTYAFEATIIKVIDGDTVQVVLSKVHPAFETQNIRLQKIDTGETGKRAKCALEAEYGDKAKKYLKNILPVGSKVVVTLNMSKKDKYNGRMLSDIYYNRLSIVKAMKDSGLAKEYDGGKKSDWCK